MQILRLNKRVLNMATWDKRFAQPGDCRTVVDTDTIIYVGDSDTPAVVYLANAVTLPPTLVPELKTTKYGTWVRASGMKPQNLGFGYSPRNPIFTRENCQKAAITRHQPELMDGLTDIGVQLDALYKQHNPATYAAHSDMTDKVLADWKIPGTIFTSGNINKNTQLPYHFDRGNFVGAWSAMVTVRNNTGGGWLACPELDVEIRNTNGSLLLFDGQGLLHGVTPISYITKDAYRFTIVYYSMAKMWQCLTPLEELKRANKVRTAREINRAKDIKHD